VINDASPEPKIIQYLQKLSENNKIKLLTNKLNMGFVKSVNTGLFHNTACDCVLLNSDTEVFHNWLDRLYSAAYSEQYIATVTPFSNNSELTSFPIIHHDNQFSGNFSASQIDLIAASVNHEKTLKIPSGVGFCFYIKRKCLTECGGLNETDILRGYGALIYLNRMNQLNFFLSVMVHQKQLLQISHRISYTS